MKQQQVEKELVIIFVGINGVVEEQHKKYGGYPNDGGKRGLPQFQQPGTAVDVVVESGDEVKSTQAEGISNNPMKY